MVSLQQQQLQIRQQLSQTEAQRRRIEDERRRLQSTRVVREMGGIEGLRQRQQGLGQLNIQQEQVQRAAQELQQADTEISQAIDREGRAAQVQAALRTLVEKGKGSEALYALSPEDRARVENLAAEIKRQRQSAQGRIAVSQVEAGLSMSLAPETRQAIFKQGAGGSALITLPSSVPRISQSTTPASFYSPLSLQSQVQSSTVQQSVYQGIPQYTSAQRVNPILGDDLLSKTIRETPGAQQRLTKAEKFIRSTFTDDPITERNIKAAAGRQGLVQGTPAYEQYVNREIQKSRAGQQIIGTAVLSVTGVPTVPSVARVPLRPLNKPLFFELQRPVITRAGEQRTLSSYEILAERIPPIARIDSTKAGGLLDRGAIRIQKPTYEITRTVTPVVDQGKVVTIRTKTGRTGMIDTLEGQSIKLDPKDVDKLPKTTQFLFKRMTGVEGGKATVVDANLQYSVGGIVRNRGGTGLPEREVSRFQTVSRTKPLRETEEAKFFQSEIFFKDVSRGGAVSRATGKTQSISGVIKVIKKPLTIEGEKANFIRPNPNIKRTPLSLAFQQTEVLEVAKPFPKTPRLPKQKLINTPSTSTSYGVTGILAGSVSKGDTRVLDGATTVGSDFARGFSKGLGTKKTTPTTAQQTQDRQLDKLAQSTPQATATTTKQIPRQTSITITVPKQAPQQTPLEIAREASGQRQLQFLRSAVGQQFVQRTQQNNELSRPLPRPKAPRPPRPPRIFFSRESAVLEVPKRFEDSQRFTAEVRRFGRFTPLTSESTLGRALTKASRLVDINLGRSFRIRGPSGEILDLSGVSAPRGFRRSKRERGILVEESRFALSTSGETGEIQAFKRRRPASRSQRRRNIFGV